MEKPFAVPLIYLGDPRDVGGVEAQPNNVHD
jgi:hypothetical protein